MPRIVFDLPGSKANTLGQAVLADWEKLLSDLEARGHVRGLLLVSGKPGMFIAGADLKELGASSPTRDGPANWSQRGLDLSSPASRICPTPPSPLIDGACMGGGLELALGFDYRLAGTNPKTELGFPEIKIGLIPGWGGTQRMSAHHRARAGRSR